MGLTIQRLEKEVKLMATIFPNWELFAVPSRGVFGFQGKLSGLNNGKIYEVVIEAKEDSYPITPPAIYIDPLPPISGNWLPGEASDGRAQVCKVKQWNPAKNTFANCVLDAVKFLRDH